MYLLSGQQMVAHLNAFYARKVVVVVKWQIMYMSTRDDTVTILLTMCI